jgi:hypothetical protein
MSNFEFSDQACDRLNTFINKYSNFINGVFKNVKINIQSQVSQLEYKQLINFLELIFNGVNGIKATERKNVYDDFNADLFQLGVQIKKSDLFNKDKSYIDILPIYILDRMERRGLITKA